jgi:hypothetical protein
VFRTSLGSFVSKEFQLMSLGSFRRTRRPEPLDRPRPVLAGAPRPHRVAGQWARSARQESRDGRTGGIGLGSTVLGSRDLGVGCEPHVPVAGTSVFRHFVFFLDLEEALSVNARIAVESFGIREDIPGA